MSCCKKDYPYVEGDRIILNSCESVQIYTTLPDGTIEINPKFNCLWKYFQPQSMIYFGGGDCGSVQEFDHPPIPTTLFTGVGDIKSGLVNFSRVSPVTAEDANNSVITSEGFPLITYARQNNEPYLRLDWNLTMEARSLSIYVLAPGASKLSLFVDTDDNLTRYYNTRSGSVNVAPGGPIYFKVDAPEGYAMTLRATAVIPNGIVNPCDPGKVLYLNFEHNCEEYSMKLFEYVKDVLLPIYYVVPFPEWNDIAQLISLTFTSTQVFIPESPIVLEDEGEQIQLFSGTHPTDDDPKNIWLITRDVLIGLTEYVGTVYPRIVIGGYTGPVLKYKNVNLLAPKSLADDFPKISYTQSMAPSDVKINNSTDIVQQNKTPREITVEFNFKLPNYSENFSYIIWYASRTTSRWTYFFSTPPVSAPAGTTTFQDIQTFKNVDDVNASIVFYDSNFKNIKPDTLFHAKFTYTNMPK